MTGRIPAWRAMAPGIGGGPDVTELERNLIALRLRRRTARQPPATLDRATTDGRGALAAATGQPVTGQIDLGRVLFLPAGRTGSAGRRRRETTASPGRRLTR